MVMLKMIKIVPTKLLLHKNQLGYLVVHQPAEVFLAVQIRCLACLVVKMKHRKLAVFLEEDRQQGEVCSEVLIKTQQKLVAYLILNL